jgi:hypothetical protein
MSDRIFHGREYEGPLPRCARCGAAPADRVCFGFIDGEMYCTGCLSPEQIEMIAAVVDAVTAPEPEDT